MSAQSDVAHQIIDFTKRVNDLAKEGKDLGMEIKFGVDLSGNQILINSLEFTQTINFLTNQNGKE